jgi:hypothetical protein
MFSSKKKRQTKMSYILLKLVLNQLELLAAYGAKDREGRYQAQWRKGGEREAKTRVGGQVGLAMPLFPIYRSTDHSVSFSTLYLFESTLGSDNRAEEQVREAGVWERRERDGKSWGEY